MAHAPRADSYDGAAFADFLPFRRVYFVPLDPVADRWTFLNGDYAHPEKGRVMPGDAFFLPDVSQIRPYIRAKGAVIDPVSSVSFDAPYDFAGSDNALSTLHYRYDPRHHSYLPFEQHLHDLFRIWNSLSKTP